MLLEAIEMFAMSKPEWADLDVDREVHIDESPSVLKLIKGERIIDSVNDVEDVKANNSVRGILSITTLRLRWQSTANPYLNASIGWNAILSLTTRAVPSKMRGDSTALVVTAKYDGVKLEFIYAITGNSGSPTAGVAGIGSSGLSGSGSGSTGFQMPFATTVGLFGLGGSGGSTGAGAASGGGTGLAVPSTPGTDAAAAAAAAVDPTIAGARIIANAQGVMRAYETSRLFRDLRLRGALIRDKKASLLAGEKLISVHDGVWNLSADQGHLGVMTVTDRRVVWHASITENFNVSVPYTVLKDVRVRDSKFGRALVFDISPRGGDYLLGFKAEPADKLEHLCKEIAAMRGAALTAPDYGIQYTPVSGPGAANAAAMAAGAAVSLPATLGGAGSTGAGAGAAGGSAGGLIEDLTISDAGPVHGAVLGSTDPFAAYYQSMRAGHADRPHGRKAGAGHGPAGEIDGDLPLRPVLFAPSLGLAIEEPPEGLTLETLWAAV